MKPNPWLLTQVDNCDAMDNLEAVWLFLVDDWTEAGLRLASDKSRSATMTVKQISVTSLGKMPPVESRFRNSSILRRFLEETSLPGWKYLITDDKAGLKLVWMVTLLCTCLFSAYSMGKYTEQYLNSSIITSIESTIAPVQVWILGSISRVKS